MDNRKIAYNKWYEENYSETKKEILDLLYNTTLTQDEICIKLNIKKGRIRFLIEKHKIKNITLLYYLTLQSFNYHDCKY